MCLIRNTELLCRKFRVICPHLATRWKSQGFSHVAVGTWIIFSSYSREDTSKLVFVQRLQDFCLVKRDTTEISTRLGSAIRMFLEVRWETGGVPF